ncbi:hypothetical protein [Clostridium tagluense]|uniref:Homeodomain phBC6A51-type domain-containing protein n=1 Tax=Clostridium tagluense TaxID=360422 RepID=A0A401UTY7_9CLOT|nr:hypothetical protein [Clostridium tagluense]GCD12991.1 hypothetical protein Ctaglu_46140 [Clostridium tagluense]
MLDKTDVLEGLEECGLVTYDEETGLPLKVEANRHLREKEVCAVLLTYIVEDVRISNRELERRTGINARTIGKYRSGDIFLKLLAEYTNKRMIGIRSLALEELERILANPKLNENTKIKGIALALQHSEKMAEIALLGTSKPEVTVDMLIKELEDM